MKRRLTASAILLTTAIIWGFAFIAQILGGDHVDAFTFNSLRFLLGGALLIPLYLIAERERESTTEDRRARHKRTAIAALICGLCLFVAISFQQFGTTLTRDPAKAGFITGLYTVLTPILYLILFRKKSGWNVWLGGLLAAGGLCLLCLREGSGFSFGWGEGVLLIGSVFWALHILIVGRFADGISLLRFSAWQFLIAGGLSLIAALIFGDSTWSHIWQAKWSILFCGVFSVGVAFTLQTVGQRHAEPTHAAIIFSTEAVFAALGGLLWNLITPPHLHVAQEILPIGYLGCALMLAGIILSQLQIRLPRREKSQKT